MVFEMEKGEQLARHHARLIQTTAEDSAPIGWWWSGHDRIATDTATLFTPALASRWMGYLNASEHWPYGELRERWAALASRLDGRVTFIVQLSAFPKSDPLELGIVQDADDRSMRLSRCILAYPKPLTRALDESDNLRTDRTEGRVECEVTPLVRLSSDRWQSLMEPYWTALVPQLAALAPEGTCGPSPYDFATGDFHTAYFLVDAPLSKEMEKAPRLSLYVLGGSRERVATFKLAR